MGDYVGLPNPFRLARQIRDRFHLRCVSPAIYYNKLWEYACMSDWAISARNSSSGEKVWSTIMLSILGLGLLALMWGCFQKLMKKRKLHNNRREYEANHEELRRM